MPLWSGILDVLSVALPVPFPVTLHPVVLPVLLAVLLLPELPLLLPVELLAALLVIISKFNLTEFMFCVLLPFVTLAFVKLAVWKTVHSYLSKVLPTM